jgi:hypothetical protein
MTQNRQDEDAEERPSDGDPSGRTAFEKDTTTKS